MCYLFDSAVTWYGNYIQAKLDEVDKQGRPKHKLEALLVDKSIPQDSADSNGKDRLLNANIPGLFSRRKSKAIPYESNLKGK